jgi:hypothetical protein
MKQIFMAIKKKKYILFHSLVKNFEEKQIISTFYIIYHDIIKNLLYEIESFFFLDILFKYNLNLYLIKNFKDGLTIIKKHNNCIYKYLYNKYKQQKYETKLNNLFEIYKNGNGIITKLFMNVDNIYNKRYIVQNNINKINKIIDSFNDKKFSISMKNLNNYNNYLNIDLNNIKIININEILNRLLLLINIFGIVSLKKIDMKILDINTFNSLNYNDKIEYYDYCINTIKVHGDNLTHDFSLYLDVLFHINFFKKQFNIKYDTVIDYCVQNTLDSIINSIEKN